MFVLDILGLSLLNNRKPVVPSSFCPPVISLGPLQVFILFFFSWYPNSFGALAILSDSMQLEGRRKYTGTKRDFWELLSDVFYLHIVGNL